MLITLSRRTAICQSVAEVQLTGVAPLGAVSHRFNFFNLIIIIIITIITIITIINTNNLDSFFDEALEKTDRKKLQLQIEM